MYKVNEPLALDGARNVRELGGYETMDGRCTRTGVFFRADGTHALTERDLAQLQKANVSLVIDMRSPDEVAQLPSRYISINGVQYENVVMFDGLQSSMFKEAMPKSMGELYCKLLDNCRTQYRRIFKLFLDNEGASMFHCTAGKDRTGVVAMLLLQLARVPEPLIVADYAISEHNLRELSKKQKIQFREIGIEVPDFVFGSRGEDMIAALQHLNDEYNGAAAYLQLCGLTEQEVLILKNRFVTDNK